MNVDTDINNNRMYFRHQEIWQWTVELLYLKGLTVYSGRDRDGYWIKTTE